MSDKGILLNKFQGNCQNQEMTRNARLNSGTHFSTGMPVLSDYHCELAAALNHDDCAQIAEALGDLVRTCWLPQLSKAIGINRPELYSGLDAKSNPRLEMIFTIVSALGCRLAIVGDGYTVAFDGDHRQVAKAIGNAARARKLRIPKSGARNHYMYWDLPYAGCPTLRTLTRLLPALGYRLTVVPLERLYSGKWQVLTWQKGGEELTLDSYHGVSSSASSLDLVRCLTYTEEKEKLSDFIIYKKMKSDTNSFRELNAALASGNLETVIKVLGDAVSAYKIEKIIAKSDVSRHNLLFLKKPVNIRLGSANRLLAALGGRLAVMDGDRILSLKYGDSEQILQILGEVVTCRGWSRTAREVGLHKTYLHSTLKSGGNPGLRHLLRIVSIVGCRLAVFRRMARSAIRSSGTQLSTGAPVPSNCYPELDAAFASGDPGRVAEELGDLVRVCGVMQVSEMTGICRQWFYSGLTATSNPCLKTISKVVAALGCRLAVVGDGYTVAFDGDHRQIVKAIGNAARAKGVRIPSKKSGGRGNRLHLSLRYVGNPTLGTLTRLMSALGYRLTVVPLERLTDDKLSVLIWKKDEEELELDSRQGVTPTASGLDLVRCLTYTKKTKQKTKPKTDPLSDFIIYTTMKSDADSFRELNAVLSSGDFKAVTKALGDSAYANRVGRIATKAGVSRQSLWLLRRHCNIGLVNVNRLLAALGCRLVVVDGNRILTLKDGDSGQILQILDKVVACRGWKRTAKEIDLPKSYLHLTLKSGGNPGLRHLFRIVSAVGCRLAVVPLRTV